VSAGCRGSPSSFTDAIRSGGASSCRLISNARLASTTIRFARARAAPEPPDCSIYTWGSSYEQALVSRNSVFPFHFTQQPFQARLTVTLAHLYKLCAGAACLTGTDAAQQSRRAGAGTRSGWCTRSEPGVPDAADGVPDCGVAGHETAPPPASSLQLATERYRVGSGTFFELLDAQVAALRAESDLRERDVRLPQGPGRARSRSPARSLR